MHTQLPEDYSAPMESAPRVGAMYMFKHIRGITRDASGTMNMELPFVVLEVDWVDHRGMSFCRVLACDHVRGLCFSPDMVDEVLP